MIKPIIYFVSDKRSYLPEIVAYKKYCTNNNIEFFEVDFSFDFDDIDYPYIKWCFMGVDKKNNSNQFLVHEYLSLSTGFFSGIKNVAKKYLSSKPDFQIFLNDSVKNVFYKPNIESTIRDMGVDDCFFNRDKNINTYYDFCYCGSMGKNRNIEKLLDLFYSGLLKDYSILLIGGFPQDLFNKYSRNNIVFVGAVPYEEVPSYLLKCRSAINYIPNRYPFNIQTSTKLLEYLALNLPVISTQYEWVEEFHKSYEFPLLFLNDKLSVEKINHFLDSNDSFPDMTEFSWDNIIRQSKVFEYVISGFYEKFK